MAILVIMSPYLPVLLHTSPSITVGAGQTGLQVAARFKRMNIPTLLIERNARVGDNWRERYPTLTLNTIRRHHTRTCLTSTKTSLLI